LALRQTNLQDVDRARVTAAGRREEINVGFADERALTEQALTAYDLDNAECMFPPVAQRILRAREALGLTQQDVAARWGEQASMYWDLELYDDEAFTVISTEQFRRLAAVLGASVSALLFGEEPSSEPPATSYAEVVARLRAKMAEEAISVEQLGDRIGWELHELFMDPDKLGDLPICGLRSVCQAAGIDWFAVVRTPAVEW
jgi:transcriptional regulator with XRE-family HTH domain